MIPMNTTQTGLLLLAKSAITQQPEVLPDGFRLEDTLTIIQKHRIISLAFEGAFLCGIPISDPVMQQLFRGYCSALQINEQQLSKLQELFRLLDAHQIDYLPLKGVTMKQRYPKPELRQMGDADILIRTEQYDAIRNIMPSLGFVFEFETDHEYVWNSTFLQVEFHKHLIPTVNKDLYPFFGSGWKLARHVSGCRYAMTPEDEFLFLFTHYVKHYREGGIGIKHLPDLWLFLRQYPELDLEYVNSRIAQLHLSEFWNNTQMLLSVWFDGCPATEKTDFMTEFIFSSGSFGSELSRILARATRAEQQSNIRISGKLDYIFRRAFPPCRVLAGKYTILKKCPWMLPVVWLYRPFYKVIFEFKSLRIQKDHIQHLSQENIMTQLDAMEYVGLSYYRGK